MASVPEAPIDSPIAAIAHHGGRVVIREATTVALADRVEATSLGWDVALSADGTRLVVSSYEPLPGRGDTGGAHVYLHDGERWVHEAHLVPSGARTGDHYGFTLAVASDGSRILLGAYMNPNAVVFVRDGTAWREEAALALGPIDGETWGTVALDAHGLRAIVGARKALDEHGVATGIARVFVRRGDAWAEEATIVPTTAVANGQFGSAVAVAGDGRLAIVGAQLGRGSVGGAAFVFTRDGASWSEDQVLADPTPAEQDLFGTSVASSADASRVVIGARLADAESAGHAVVFVREAGSFHAEATLRDPTPGPMDQLGASVAMSADGSVAFLGSPTDRTSRGSARCFTRDAHRWTHAGAYEGSDATLGSGLGTSVALDGTGGIAAVGIYGEDADGVRNVGSVRVLTIAPFVE